MKFIGHFVFNEEFLSKNYYFLFIRNLYYVLVDNFK